MIDIKKLEPDGYLVTKGGREMCKINKTKDGWIIRGGDLTGKEFGTDLIAFNTITRHYNEGGFKVKNDKPQTRDVVLVKLCNSLKPLSHHRQIKLITAHMSIEELTELTNQL